VLGECAAQHFERVNVEALTPEETSSVAARRRTSQFVAG